MNFCSKQKNKQPKTTTIGCFGKHKTININGKQNNNNLFKTTTPQLIFNQSGECNIRMQTQHHTCTHKQHTPYAHATHTRMIHTYIKIAHTHPVTTSHTYRQYTHADNIHTHTHAYHHKHIQARHTNARCAHTDYINTYVHITHTHMHITHMLIHTPT
eukprot:GHVS01027659.1.p1 GENE.GHVS01027659.1~~GHVS01027659.1.p1  ORF type:complete len:158 (+),score=25.77 GHVS01027659.1:113-586(+)